MGATDVQQPGDVVEQPLLVESRWPPGASLLVFMGLTIALRRELPEQRLVNGPWVVPAIELLLLVVLLSADPGTRTKRTTWLRPVSLALVSLLLFAALWATAVLIYHLIIAAKVTEEAAPLLAVVALIGLANILLSNMIYW